VVAEELTPAKAQRRKGAKKIRKKERGSEGFRKIMNVSAAQNYLDDVRKALRAYKKMTEKSFAQLRDDEFFRVLDPEANSIAVIVKHISGNMLSRWTDFLTTDGEKPDRHRDLEFVITGDTTRAEVLAQWERGWACVFAALDPLTEDDLTKTVTIRGEVHTVVEAINRQLMHYPMHIGQIVFLAKHFRSAEWQSLSIPRNRSADFNAYLTGQLDAGASFEDRYDAVEQFSTKDKNPE
jgi:hypothetical protein